jgi:hypothetical protein
MKDRLSLAKDVIGRKKYYLVIDDEFYIRVRKKLWYELAEYLKIDLSQPC